MPAYHNPSGEKAYIMNMYTHPEYWRRGIARKLLDLLVPGRYGHFPGGCRHGEAAV